MVVSPSHGRRRPTTSESACLCPACRGGNHPPPMPESLVDAVRAALAAAADPSKAAGMQAYMKSAMPYRGVQSPAQRRIYRDVFAAHPLPNKAAWKRAMLTLWRQASYREERYAALALAGAKRYDNCQTLDMLRVYEEFV